MSEKSTEQSKGYETKIKDIEGAMEERKHTLEKIEIARDALTMQLRNLEQTLQEKDIQVEVSFLDDYRIRSSQRYCFKRKTSNCFEFISFVSYILGSCLRVDGEE